MADEHHPPSTSVKSAMRTLDIIEYVVSRGRPVVAQEIASALVIPVSSLSYLLSTLVDRGYLEREGRRYGAGPGLQRLQDTSQVFTLVDRVAPLVRALRVQLNETASFFVRRHWQVEALATATSEHALRYAVQTGALAPLHSMSSGKALLATMPENELVRYFAETDRASMTPFTITSESALREEMEIIKKRGIAHTREEHTLGIHGLGCVARINGEVVGAFSIAIPSVRFNDSSERRAVDLLTRTADLLGSA